MPVLDGYRVLDLSIAMSGPLAAMCLGDLGADVIKIEPVTGEWQRHASVGGATGHQVNASFLALNRNKRSLAVDLKDDRGRALLRELVAGTDVFLQNCRPGVGPAPTPAVPARTCCSRPWAAPCTARARTGRRRTSWSTRSPRTPCWPTCSRPRSWPGGTRTRTASRTGTRSRP